MKNKKEIVENWLPRYTGIELSEMSDFVLLTNFQHYLNEFAHIHYTKVNGLDKAMPNATANGVTMINFGMGSANAATVMDLLSASNPKAVLFLGKCGGLKKKNELGDFILPIAAIIGMTALEVLVAVLQAYVFTVLTCIYLNDALNLHH